MKKYDKKKGQFTLSDTANKKRQTVKYNNKINKTKLITRSINRIYDNIICITN